MTNPTDGAGHRRAGRARAVTTRIPAGIVMPEQLETIAGVCRRYGVPILKITSGQRILFAGLNPEDVPRVIADLGTLAQPESSPGLKFVQTCLGADLCRYGKQDSVGLARALDERLNGLTSPAKIKIGVSGCPRCCSESHTRDIGFIASPGGWTVLFGGNAGARPRLGDLIARDLTAGEAVDCAGRLAEYYRDHARPHERTARFMERIGMATLGSELLSLLPYIPLEKVNRE